MNKFTAYIENTAKIPDKYGRILHMYQLTPTNFIRFDNDKPEDYANKFDDQILAEFLGYSDFNRLDEIKFIYIR